MVVQDFDLLFDIIDTDFKGHLTVEEVQLFDESTFFEALDLVQISAAFKPFVEMNMGSAKGVNLQLCYKNWSVVVRSKQRFYGISRPLT